MFTKISLKSFRELFSSVQLIILFSSCFSTMSLPSSQRDFFLDSDDEAKKQSRIRMCSTLPDKLESKYNYIILFDWNVDLKNPFASYKLAMFTEKDIKPNWIKSKLGTKSRVSQLRNLSPFPGGIYSLFSKFEKGCIF